MEQSVAKPKRFKKPATFLVVLLALWLVPSLALLNLSRSYTNSLAQINELGIRVNELRQSLYFSEPLRVSRINDLALNAQLVYSIRLQIESDFQHALFRPDVNQLLYVTDQFLENFDEFIPIESQVQDLVYNIKVLRADSNLSPSLKPLLIEFGVVVFEAMYSDNQRSSATYRAFDMILEKSYSLGIEEQDAMQQLLAEASTLLGDYAKLNYLVDKIKINSVTEQIIKLEAKFHNRQFKLLVMMLGLSLVAVFVLAVWGARSKTRREEESKPSFDSDINLSKQDAFTMANQEERVFSTSRSGDVFSAKTDRDAYVGEDGHLNESCEVSLPEKNSITNQQTIEQSNQDVPEAERSVASVINSKPAIDIEDMLETLDGDVESVELLLGVFVQDHAEDFTKFKSLLADDQTSAVRVVHSLKGVAGTIKASRLAIIATSIELTMKQSSPIEEHDLMELELAIKASVDFAQAYLDRQR
ncbi:Hpt domain-containing protein [Vibrio minamisatsumaniensis]